MVAFYWQNFIHFGMGPRANEQGELVLALPLGGVKLPGIAGESLSGDEMASKLAAVLGRPVSFHDMPFDAYRALGFPGAEDLGDMFQFHQILGEEFQRHRDAARARSLYPELHSFGAWL